MDNIISKIKEKLNKGEEVSPFLFTGKNLEIVNEKVITLAKKLLKEFDIPNVYLYIFNDNSETIKVKEIKEFISYSNSKPPYKFQIFFIENISRLNIASSNSLLKFFEEP
jgi:DNA polymerase III delta prime subunit